MIDMYKKKLRLLILVLLMVSFFFTYTVCYAEDTATPTPSTGPTSTTEPKPVTEPTPTPLNVVNLSFAGDVMFEKKIENIITKNGLAYIFSEVKPYFKSSDISMINLETPVSKRGEREKNKQFTFRANPYAIRNLTKASGINFVSLANNHVLDYGRIAFLDTLDFLKKEKIHKAGAGENIKKASAAVIVEKNGHKIAILASSRVVPFKTWFAEINRSGVASTYNTDIIKKEIKDARKKADIVIVYVHWGNERAEFPIKIQKDLAKTYIDCGADIVVGSHPHVLEGIELYKKGIIAYSLGNFVFTDLKKDTMIFNITIENKKINKVRIIPCEIQNYRPVIIKDKARYDSFISKMNKLSFNARIDKKGEVVLPWK